MSTHSDDNERIALLQGTLDVLILKTLLFAPCHGQGIARSIQRQSEEVFFVDHGSLYLALQRLEEGKLISAKWGVSENNRKARFYTLTATGREQLATKAEQWNRLTRAMSLILGEGFGVQGEEA
jgi:transcriptional regulator